MDDALERSLRLQFDKSEISECLVRYARGMDRLDRALARSAYHDGAIDDHVGFVGGVDDFLDWAFAYHGAQVRHQHYLTNTHIELQGDTAHVETYYTFIGTEPDPTSPLTVFGGRYIDRFERRDGSWGIAVRICLVEWATDPRSLLSPEAAEFAAVAGTVARDATDSSYERPLESRRTGTES
jgi:hypothetical protein